MGNTDWHSVEQIDDTLREIGDILEGPDPDDYDDGDDDPAYKEEYSRWMAGKINLRPWDKERLSAIMEALEYAKAVIRGDGREYTLMLYKSLVEPQKRDPFELD